ncbi:MAG: hypothetical protein AB1586_01325 [Pseudomonadota bacterium]|jgi:hypothetical protein
MALQASGNTVLLAVRNASAALVIAGLARIERQILSGRKIRVYRASGGLRNR